MESVIREEVIHNIMQTICGASQEQNMGNNNTDQHFSMNRCDNQCKTIPKPKKPEGPDSNCNSYFVGNECLCYMCNGPCYEDPLCATCHAFLCPKPKFLGNIYETRSDSDSGNEELDTDDGQDSENANTESNLDILEALTKKLNSLEFLASENGFFPIDIEFLPAEVLMHIFKYLDDTALWCVGQVCSRWRELLFMCVKPERWREYTYTFWPLFPKCYNQNCNWYEVYSSMMKRVSCLKCVKQMAAREKPIYGGTSSWLHRLNSELKAMHKDPLDGIKAVPLDKSYGHWQAVIEGPKGSPYEGGCFFLYILVPPNYPISPPIVRFITKIFHPNISRHGDIGIDIIQHNWSLALTISKVLISIQSLLTDPFCEVSMESKIAYLYLTDRKLFEEKAKEWTTQYAMHYNVTS